MRRFLTIAGLLLLSATTVASAQEAPKWSYIEAGFIDFDPDGGVSDDGFYAGGSMGLFKMFHLVAEYDDVGEYTFWNAGIGWHGLFGDPLDLFAEVVWTDVEVDSSNFSDDGYEVGAGLRWKLATWLELNGRVNWVDLDQSGDDTTFAVGAIASIIDDRLGFGATWETGDADTLRAFVRFNFGR